MRIFHRPKKPGGFAGSSIAVRLQALRLLKFFENSREYLSLLDDGEEKSGGEYILDLHYISSLVEKILERMNMIVHDACVLAPEGGEHLYHRLDAETRLAGERFIGIDRNSIIDLEPVEGAAALPSDPEYILLRQTLKWMTGGETGPDPSSLKHLFHEACGHVFLKNPLTAAGGENLPAAELNTSSSSNILRVTDLEATQSGFPAAASADSLACRPLELMILGAGGSGPTGATKTRPVREWVGVTSSDSLNLVAAGPGGAVQLAVKQSRDSETDYIFILSGRTVNLGEALSSGFRTEQTGFGSISCIYDKSAEEFEHCLTRMGQAFFSGAWTGSST